MHLPLIPLIGFPSVKTQYPGRLGNKLFQYCFGRIIADALQFNFDAEHVPGFSHATSLRRLCLPSIGLKEEVLNGHKVDVEKVVANRKKRIIRLLGHFQRYEYYRKHKEKIRSWLSVPTSNIPGTEDLVIHIRSGDLWQVNRSNPPNEGQLPLPFSFYKQIIEQRVWEKIYIITEMQKDPMVQKLAASYSALVQSKSEIEDFCFLASGHNIVLSVSTFAWWASWLSRAKQIFFPLAGFWNPDYRVHYGKNPEMDLIVDDEPRYEFINVTSEGNWRGTEQDRQRLLNT